MTCILGVDPGVSGAIAFYYPTIDRISVYDVPVAGGEIDVANLATIIRNYQPTVAIIEKVGAFPGQGVSSVFNFGRSYGDVRGAICALNIPMHLVSPQKWKKYFGLSSDKDQSRLLAIRLFPLVADQFKLKKHDGRAEAALIARYHAEMIGKQDAA